MIWLLKQLMIRPLCICLNKFLSAGESTVFSNPKFPSFAKVFPQAPVGNFLPYSDCLMSDCFMR